MAVKQWIGGAQAVKQISTVTIAGTVLATETFTITIGGASIVFTVAGTATVTAVAEGLVALANATDAPAQFKEAVWSNLAGVITAIGATAGVPFTIQVGETSASGTITPATPTAATGPNHFNNAANWSGGTLPADGDTVVLSGSYAIQHGLTNALGGGESFAEIQIPRSFTGTVGLPESNARGYLEYRTKFLEWHADKFIVGGGEGNGSSMVKLKAGASTVDAVVFTTGSAFTQNEAPLQLIGVLNDVTIESGNVSIAGRALETATVVDLIVGTNATVTVGQQVTLTNVTTGGTTFISSDCTVLNVNGGNCTVIDSEAATIDISGGALAYDSEETITAATVGPGVLDCTDLRPRTCTALTMRPGGQLVDPRQSLEITTLELASNVGSLSAF